MFDVDVLKAYSNVRKYDKNEVIIYEGGQSPYSLYIILSGTVKVFKDYAKPYQTTVGSLRKGDFFGEMSLFLKKPRTATVVAAEVVTLLEISQDNVYEVIRLNPQMFYEILKALCMRVDELNTRVRSLR
ncbi:MAG: cyclic nucleotide-binding domain-containing protein [Defluviitaleaceae bacterium]|nr:cyclic nucleotide-binding domain-containing protein [Defluviitaleaceae bacterium]